MPRALVPLAEGVEEMEAVIIVDVLRRAGVDVVTAAIASDLHVKASRGVMLVADTHWPEEPLTGFDALALPGGAGGAQRLLADARVLAAVSAFVREERIVAAICAAPLVLQAAGVLKGKRVTSHPSVREKLAEALYTEDRVVTDGNIITSRGPGTAMEFALALVARLIDARAAGAVAGGLVLPAGSVIPCG